MKDLSYMPLIDYIDYINNIYFCEAISSRAQCNNKHIDLGVMDLELNDRETDEHGDPTLIQSIRVPSSLGPLAELSPFVPDANVLLQQIIKGGENKT